MVAPQQAGTFATSSVGQLAAGNVTAQSVLGTAAGVAGVVGAADLLSESQQGNTLGATIQGGSSGAAIGGSIAGYYGAIVGGIVGAVVGFGKSFEGGKSRNQAARDGFRDLLQQQGLAVRDSALTGTNDHAIQLADGSFYSIGRDGDSAWGS